jgi:hypothetical protein
MSAEENMARRFLEARGRADLDAMEEMMAPDFVDHDPQREMFGFPRLRRLVAEHAEKGSLVDFLLDELRSFTGDGWEQEDDITLMTLQRSS